MINILITILIILIILILICAIRVTIHLEYKINNKKDNIKFNFTIFGGIIKYKLYPDKKNREEQEEVKKEKSKDVGLFDKIDNFVKLYKTFSKIQLYLKEKLVLKKINIELDFGTGDAYYTGILTGFIWSFAGIVISYLFETFQKCDNKVSINAKFSEKTINGQFLCIFNIKFVYIIVVVIKILFDKLKKSNQKGGDISA